MPGPSSGVFDYCTKAMPIVPKPPATEDDNFDDRLIPLQLYSVALELYEVRRDKVFKAEQRLVYVHNYELQVSKS